MAIASFLSDEELLARYQKGDSEAFDEFFNRHKKIVFNFLLSRLRNRVEAEDAFQKTFLRIHHYILSYDSNRNALGWVMTIARNVALDLRPRQQAPLGLDEADLSRMTTEPLAALEARSALDGLLLSLTGKERELVERRFINEESFEDIARTEGWSSDNARQRICRLTRKLKCQTSAAPLGGLPGQRPMPSVTVDDGRHDPER